MSHDADRLIEVLWHINNTLKELTVAAKTSNVIAVSLAWPDASELAVVRTLERMGNVETRR